MEELLIVEAELNALKTVTSIIRYWGQKPVYSTLKSSYIL